MKYNKKYIFGLTTFVILVVLTTVGFTKSEVYQQIARSQRLINNVYKYLITEYVDPIDIETYTRKSIQSIVEELDPYTVYMEDHERDGLDLLTKGKYGGVGIQIGKREGKLTVIAPMDESPAQRAGIISGDIIVAVDGESTGQLNLDETSSMIRGVKGTQVSLTISRSGLGEELVFDLIREDIKVKDVAYTSVLENDIGYVRLTRFSKNSIPETRQALSDLVQSDVNGIILDLRDNPGGLLYAAIEILDMFIPEGQELLTTKGRTNKSTKFYESKKPPIVPEEIPVAILINSGSASASEIVAGAIQDLDRGVIVGTRSFGKGLVQSVYQLGKNKALKITTAKYYIPSGRLIQKPGYIDEDVTLDQEKPDSIFTTSRGRTVKGGGGISPDYEIDDKERSILIRECWRKGYFFSFVQKTKTDYTSMEEVLNDKNLVRKFSEYLDTSELDLKIDGEYYYTKAKKIFIENESQSEQLTEAFSLIDNYIKNTEDKLFIEGEKDIKEELFFEYANHFEGKNGRFQRLLKNDNVVKSASEILVSPVAYNDIFNLSESH